MKLKSFVVLALLQSHAAFAWHAIYSCEQNSPAFGDALFIYTPKSELGFEDMKKTDVMYEGSIALTEQFKARCADPKSTPVEDVRNEDGFVVMRTYTGEKNTDRKTLSGFGKTQDEAKVHLAKIAERYIEFKIKETSDFEFTPTTYTPPFALNAEGLKNYLANKSVRKNKNVVFTALDIEVSVFNSDHMSPLRLENHAAVMELINSGNIKELIKKHNLIRSMSSDLRETNMTEWYADRLSGIISDRIEIAEKTIARSTELKTSTEAAQILASMKQLLANTVEYTSVGDHELVELIDSIFKKPGTAEQIQDSGLKLRDLMNVVVIILLTAPTLN